MAYKKTRPGEKFAELVERGKAVRNGPKLWSSAEDFISSEYGQIFREAANYRTSEQMLDLWRTNAPRQPCVHCRDKGTDCLDPPPTKRRNTVRCAACVMRGIPCSLVEQYRDWLVEQCLDVHGDELTKYKDWTKEVRPKVPRESKLHLSDEDEESSDESESESDYDSPNSQTTPVVKLSRAERAQKRAGNDDVSMNGVENSPTRALKRKVPTTNWTPSSSKVAELSPDQVKELTGKVSVETRDDGPVIVIHRNHCKNLVFQPAYVFEDGDIENRINDLSEVFSHLYRIEFRSSRGNLEKELRSILSDQEKTLKAEHAEELKKIEARKENEIKSKIGALEGQLDSLKARSSSLAAELSRAEKERDENQRLLQSAHGLIATVKDKEDKLLSEKRQLSSQLDELKSKLANGVAFTPPPSTPSHPPSSSKSSVTAPADSASLSTRLEHALEQVEAAERRLQFVQETAAAMVRDLGDVSTWVDGFARQNDQPSLADVARELFTITGRLSVIGVQDNSYMRRKPRDSTASISSRARN